MPLSADDKITVELKDGLVIDISGLLPEAAVARLRAAGVQLGDIRNTRHVVAAGPRDCRVCGGAGYLETEPSPAPCRYCSGTGKE